MSSIRGPLNVEVSGADDAPPMVFVHPNPMDSSCWLVWLLVTGVRLVLMPRKVRAA